MEKKPGRKQWKVKENKNMHQKNEFKNKMNLLEEELQMLHKELGNFNAN